MPRNFAYPACLFLLVLGLGALVYFGGSGPELRREAFGVARVGPIADFLAPFTIDAEHRLLFRRDERGLSAMSLRCTRDLEPLVQRSDEAGFRFVSPYNGSEYSASGQLLQGPALADLPYYFLALDAAQHGAKPDTLFVVIGRMVSPDWRLPLPELAGLSTAGGAL